MQAVTAALVEAAHAALPGRPVFLLQQWIEGAAEFAPEGGELVARGPQFALYRLEHASLTACLTGASQSELRSDRPQRALCSPDARLPATSSPTPGCR